MLLSQWRSFAAIAEEGSVMLAAARLRLAQPALTRQMQSLEREVGTRLLVRGHRGSSLTEAGAAFLADVRIIFGELDEMLARVHLAAQGRIGTVRIGLSRGAMDSEVLRRGLTALNRVLPEVRVVVTELADGQQVHELRMRTIDVAIGPAPRSLHDLMSAHLLDVELGSVVVPAGHKLAARESIHLRDLAGEPLLLVDWGPEDGPSPVVAQLQEHGLSPAETLLSAESVHSSIAAGKGWTLASHDTHPPTGAVVRPLAGASFTEKIEARWRAGDQSPVVVATVAALREAMGGERATPGEAPVAAPASGAGLELRHLQAVVATAELRSVTHAAQRLSLTQSGLTRRLQMAESEAGVTLLRRSSAGVETTAAGEVFREGAARILALVDEAVTRARTIGEGIAGRCVVAAVSSEFSGKVIVGAINELAQRHPAVSVDVADMLTPAQLLALRERRADVGIAGAHLGVVDDEDLAGQLLLRDNIESALMSSDHPLASRAVLEPSDLAGVPFAFLDRASFPEFFDIVMKALREIGLVPLISSAFNGPRALWRGAADIGGWTLGTRSMLTHPRDGMTAVPVRGLSIPSGHQLVWRRDERNPTVLALLDVLRRQPAAIADARQ